MSEIKTNKPSDRALKEFAGELLRLYNKYKDENKEVVKFEGSDLS